MKIKSSQIYGWDEEPVDERPSEFASTTGYSSLTGHSTLAVHPVRPRRSRGVVGFKSLVAFCLVIIALGAYVITRLAPMIRG